jgi:hypothetical protein
VVDEMMCAFGACAVEEGDEYREHIVGLHFVFYERLGFGTGCEPVVR